MKDIMEVLMQFVDVYGNAVLFLTILGLIVSIIEFWFQLKRLKLSRNFRRQLEKFRIIEEEETSIIADIKREQKNINKASYSERKKNSIVEDIYFKKIEQYHKASALISFSTVIYLYNIFLFTRIKIEVIIFLFALIGFTKISRLLIRYRVKKGYYGTNYEESKEILYYMTADRDKNNKNSGKKIFDDIDAYNKVEEKIPADGKLQY